MKIKRERNGNLDVIDMKKYQTVRVSLQRESDFYIEQPSQRRNKIGQKLNDQKLLCLLSLKKEGVK